MNHTLKHFLMVTCAVTLAVGPITTLAEGLIQHSPRPLQAEAQVSNLESWETSIENFFIRSHHGVPLIAEKENYKLHIDGLVEHPLVLTLDDLAKEPQMSLHAVLECSGNGRGLQDPKVPGVQWEKGAVGNAEWTGASLAELLKRAGVKPNAHFATVEGADKPALPTVPGFVRSVPIAKLMEKDSLLALKMNRVEIPLLHGGPLRLVLPRWYGQNWIKWVTRLTLTEKEDDGFYMKKAYRMPKKPVKPGENWDSTTGDAIQAIRVQSYLVSPTAGSAVTGRKITVKGKAFSGTGTIAKVEISKDNGRHWQEAKVEAPHASGGWQEFQTELELPKSGQVTLWSKATDTEGHTQSKERGWNPPGYLQNAMDRISFHVGSAQSSQLGANLVTEKCLICHARELIESQRLSTAAWEKTVKKMETFGAKLNDEERNTLISYLSHFSSQLPPVKPPKTNFDREAFMIATQLNSNGDKSTGAELYSTHCASCHGKEAEGKLGPRLRLRDIPVDIFTAKVMQGSGTMPSFSDSLKTSEVEAIRSYLVTPDSSK